MTDVQLGLRANARQFGLLVLLNGFVGAMVGLERSVLPLVGERDFHLDSHVAILSFVVAFGVAKAVSNLAAGGLADRVGRKRLLVAGWLLALPVPLLIAVAPNWSFVVAANVFLGASQGFAWSMTVLMKIDLAGPRRRGLALGLNESAGYLGVALAAFATGALAATFAPRTVVWVGALIVVTVGLLASILFVRDTAAYVELEQRDHGNGGRQTLRQALRQGTFADPVLRACSQAGLANNLNDALAWGLVPLYLAANGASVTEIGLVAAAYPAVWGLGQLLTGWLSDHTGRKPLIVAGMLVQTGALALLVAGGGGFAPALARSGTARRGHCARLPDPDCRSLRCGRARPTCARCWRLPLLARLRLRRRRPDHRHRRRHARRRQGDRRRRRSHRGERPLGGRDTLVGTSAAIGRTDGRHRQPRLGREVRPRYARPTR